MIEAVFIFYRRWASAASAVNMETTLRNDLYAHLQRLPVSFHDGWQSGQLLSRVTSDLSVLRRFLTFGLIFLFINFATFVTVVILLIHLFWPLGLLVSISAVPLFFISQRFTREYNVAARKMQDQQGDLATLVEETRRRHPGDQGIRAPGPHGRPVRRTGVQRCTSTAVSKTRMVATTWPSSMPSPT